MMPACSRSRTRRAQGDGDNPTVSASSLTVILPSACSAAMIFRSMSSREGIGSFHLEFGKDWLSEPNDGRIQPGVDRILPKHGIMLSAISGDAVMADAKLAMLGDLERKVLWLATWMIHNANHLRDNEDGLKVGGHQASSA